MVEPRSVKRERVFRDMSTILIDSPSPIHTLSSLVCTCSVRKALRSDRMVIRKRKRHYASRNPAKARTSTRPSTSKPADRAGSSTTSRCGAAEQNVITKKRKRQRGDSTLGSRDDSASEPTLTSPATNSTLHSRADMITTFGPSVYVLRPQSIQAI